MAEIKTDKRPKEEYTKHCKAKHKQIKDKIEQNAPNQKRKQKRKQKQKKHFI